MQSILVCCAHSWRVSTRLMFLTTLMFPRVLTSPSLTDLTFPYSKLKQARLAYFRLHGMVDQPYLYGDRWQTAFDPDGFATMNLEGLIVFMEGCYGLRTRIPEKFLACGAKAVIASSIPTEARTVRVSGSSKFGRDFVRKLVRGSTVKESLEFAESRAEEYLVKAFEIRGDGQARLKE